MQIIILISNRILDGDSVSLIYYVSTSSGLKLVLEWAPKGIVMPRGAQVTAEGQVQKANILPVSQCKQVQYIGS